MNSSLKANTGSSRVNSNMMIRELRKRQLYLLILFFLVACSVSVETLSAADPGGKGKPPFNGSIFGKRSDLKMKTSEQILDELFASQKFGFSREPNLQAEQSIARPIQEQDLIQSLMSRCLNRHQIIGITGFFAQILCTGAPIRGQEAIREPANSWLNLALSGPESWQIE